jgi:hypothetical protein
MNNIIRKELKFVTQAADNLKTLQLNLNTIFATDLPELEVIQNALPYKQHHASSYAATSN